MYRCRGGEDLDPDEVVLVHEAVEFLRDDTDDAYAHSPTLQNDIGAIPHREFTLRIDEICGDCRKLCKGDKTAEILLGHVKIMVPRTPRVIADEVHHGKEGTAIRSLVSNLRDRVPRHHISRIKHEERGDRLLDAVGNLPEPGESPHHRFRRFQHPLRLVRHEGGVKVVGVEDGDGPGLRKDNCPLREESEDNRSREANDTCSHGYPERRREFTTGEYTQNRRERKP